MKTLRTTFRLITLSILGISVTYCSGEKRNNIIGQFTNDLELKGKVIKVNEKYSTGRISIADNVLVLSNTMMSTKQIHLYNKNTFEYLGAAGKIGQGPGEIVVPLFSQMDLLKKGIWLYDAGKRQLDYFEIDSILNYKDYLFRKSIPIPSAKTISYYRQYNNELFAFTDTSPHFFISFFDTNGVIRDDLSIRNNINIYKRDELIYESSLPLIYYHIALNDKLERAAIVYRFANVVLIIQNDGMLIRRLQGKDEAFQIPSNDDTNQIITYYMVDYDSEYIYCLYKNEKRKDGDIPIYPKEMHVFDWDGNQTSKMIFDYNISSFKADLASNTLYTYSPDVNSFVTYNIEHLSTKLE